MSQLLARTFALLAALTALYGCALLHAGQGDKFTPLSTAVPASVKVLFEQDAKTFPYYWQEMKSTPLPASSRHEPKQVLTRALSKYPAEVLERHLKRVFIFNKIEYQGMSYGGTYDYTSGTVYLLNVFWAPGFIEESLHHEFSSLLLIKYPPKFFTGKWQILSDHKKFLYSTGGVDALKSGKTSTRYDRKMMEQGFLNEYSTADPEEDFNCIAEGLFCGGKQFWAYVDEYPLVKAKVDLVIRFYNSVDKRFTESYFRQLPMPASGSTRQ